MNEYEKQFAKAEELLEMASEMDDNKTYVQTRAEILSAANARATLALAAATKANRVITVREDRP